MALSFWLLLGVLAAQPQREPAVSAVGSPQGAPTAEEEQALRGRVARWWDARISNDRRTLYDLFSPEYRAKTSYEDFVAESAVRYRVPVFSYSILEVQIDGTRARVMLSYSVMPKPGPPIDSRIEDEWLREDGQWFKVYKPPVPPFPPFTPEEPAKPAPPPLPPPETPDPPVTR